MKKIFSLILVLAMLPVAPVSAEGKDVVIVLDPGHGGMDSIEFRVFVDCLRAGKPMPIDVYDAAAWMSVTALSEASVAAGGLAQAIPDFTSGMWTRRKPLDVVPLSEP
jgi:hypothetical protein